MTFKALVANARQLERDAAAYRKELERLRGRLDKAEQLIASVTRDIDLLDVTDVPTASRNPKAKPKPKPKGKKRRRRRTDAEIAEVKALVVKRLAAGATRDEVCREANLNQAQLWRWLRDVPEIKAARKAGITFRSLGPQSTW